MAIGEATGCLLISYGPPLWLMVLTVANDPVRVIVLAASAFCWLLAMMFSSVIWFVVIPLRTFLPFGMFFSIILQEVFRYGVYKLLDYTKSGLQQIADTELMNNNKHIFAYVTGLGFGFMSGAFAFLNVIADSTGPATVGLKSGSNYFLLTSAFITLCIILLHTFWNVVFFSALDENNYLKLSWVVISHFVFSYFTLFNKYELYYLSIIPAYTILIITMIIAYKTVGGSFNTFKNIFQFK